MPQVDKYYMLGHTCLARATLINDDGFEFDCVNGGWSGIYNSVLNTVTIKGRPRDTLGNVHIVSDTQPPNGMYDYNQIIPFMLEHPICRK